ncbi:GNAT family N-acetyltransferase [Azospirillum doebereinerae]|uniref:GNAT family N-acetyltransferase n=1 Tax=Azospirillum doebereinerae TaxID=92933 RepID=UPI001EE5F460|nr:GNAT family N-acetyltransferase [Azospirillum doebereinerae]MCG5240776.1 GNAT family N-acetyltransferase [Azospirillum doebereinerae]
MDTHAPSPRPSDGLTILSVPRLDEPALRAGLEALLKDAVASGASVGFHAPLDPVLNGAFWDEIAADLAKGRLTLLIARDEAGAVVGCVQLAPSPKQNARHRAEVRKLLVHSAQRRRGIARRLMEALYASARDQGRVVLQLDTLAGDVGEPFYRATGWTQVGVLPEHTLEADGRYHDTVLFHRRL